MSVVAEHAQLLYRTDVKKIKGPTFKDKNRTTLGAQDLTFNLGTRTLADGSEVPAVLKVCVDEFEKPAPPGSIGHTLNRGEPREVEMYLRDGLGIRLDRPVSELLAEWHSIRSVQRGRYASHVAATGKLGR